MEWSQIGTASEFLHDRFAHLARDGFCFERARDAVAETMARAVARISRFEWRTPSSFEWRVRPRFSAEFRDWYFLPMIGCIWSCPTDQMLRFPIATMIRFCHNHGLIRVTDRPQWHTVVGGARHYVEIVSGRRSRIASCRRNISAASPIRR